MRVIADFNLVLVASMQQVCTVFLKLLV